MAHFLRGFIASFRNLCIDPSGEMSPVFKEMEQLRDLLHVV
jgi:hypothetical protein